MGQEYAIEVSINQRQSNPIQVEEQNYKTRSTEDYSSVEACPPELALIEEPPRDAAFQKVQFVEYRPTSQLNSGPLQFIISPTANQYIDLKHSRLHVKVVQIIKGLGSAPNPQ